MADDGKTGAAAFREFLKNMTPEERTLYRLENKWKHPRNRAKWEKMSVRIQARLSTTLFLGGALCVRAPFEMIPSTLRSA